MTNIIYNSEEIKDIENNLMEQERILKSDIEKSLERFNVLQELDLYGEGLNSLKKQIQELGNKRNRIASMLNEHDNDLIAFEKEQTALVNNMLSINDSNISHYDGSSVKTDNILVDEVEKGKQIKLAELKEIIFEFTYDEKLEMLKKMFAYNDYSLDSVLTDSDHSDKLTERILEIMNLNPNSINGELEEKELQKSFLNAIASDIPSLFKDLEQKSILQSESYLMKVADENNITFGDLITDPKNEIVLTEALRNVYEGNASDLSPAEQQNVKEYLDSICENTGLTIEELLDNDNMKFIKGGEI